MHFGFGKLFRGGLKQRCRQYIGAHHLEAVASGNIEPIDCFARNTGQCDSYLELFIMVEAKRPRRALATTMAGAGLELVAISGDGNFLGGGPWYEDLDPACGNRRHDHDRTGFDFCAESISN